MQIHDDFDGFFFPEKQKCIVWVDNIMAREKGGDEIPFMGTNRHIPPKRKREIIRTQLSLNGICECPGGYCPKTNSKST